jgi:hypothetical protein
MAKVYMSFQCFFGSVLFAHFISISSGLQPRRSVALSQQPRESVLAYRGPLSTIDEIEFGFEIEELGLNLMMGKSRVGEGRGLFLGLGNDVENSFIEKGTVLCGYSKGTFETAAASDKTVGCYFSDISTNVIFEKQIMPLYDAIFAISGKVSDLSRALVGHTLQYESTVKSNELSLQPAENYGLYYFIPQMPEVPTIVNLGMYANDLAYSSKLSTEEEYEKATDEKNILNIIWRMEFKDNALRPTWPVVIFNKDILFTNKEPMEVGIQYSWSYWKNHRELRRA